MTNRIQIETERIMKEVIKINMIMHRSHQGYTIMHNLLMFRFLILILNKFFKIKKEGNKLFKYLNFINKINKSNKIRLNIRINQSPTSHQILTNNNSNLDNISPNNSNKMNNPNLNQ
jgi:hypothetical protein